MASKKFFITILCVTALSILAVGCGSDNDSNPAAPVVDTTPPALPSGLTADYSARQHAATISWDMNVSDADFAGFLVSRSSYDNDAVELVSEPQAAASYFDADLLSAGRQVTYYIYAVDAAGNVSAAASISVDVEADPADGDERFEF